MRKKIIILGTILIAAMVLISGSAVSVDYATSVYSDADCENSEEALGEPDDTYATVGTNIPDPSAGDLILDFGFIGIPINTWVTVYRQDPNTGFGENYTVRFWTPDFSEYSSWSVASSDLVNNSFYSGAPSIGAWEFIEIHGEDGGITQNDPIYGPEIDAVGY